MAEQSTTEAAPKRKRRTATTRRAADPAPDPPTSLQSALDVDVDAHNTVDLSQALTLRIKHKLPYGAIAAQMGVTKQAIHQRLKRFLPLLTDTASTDEYECYKGQLLSSVELALVEQLVDKDKIKEASLNNVAYAFQQVSNAGRLARGESTENINLVAVQGDLALIREQREQLARELRSLNPDDTPQGD